MKNKPKTAAAKIRAASIPPPADYAGCDDRIRRLGNTQHTLAVVEAHLAADLAKVKARYEKEAAPLHETQKQLAAGIRKFCAKHRRRLLKGTSRSHEFPAGTVTWRRTPAAVKIKGSVANVVAACRTDALAQFIRVTTTIDREAMLKSPEVAREIAGVEIAPGEQFEITPFTVKLARGGAAKKKGGRKAAAPARARAKKGGRK